MLWTTEAVSPSLDGWWRPAIRMPERLRGELEDDELAAVLAHEQAHLRRKDHLLFALLYLLRGLSWCIWPIAIIANSLEESVERLCDRAAASQTHPKALARALVKVTSFRLTAHPRAAHTRFFLRPRAAPAAIAGAGSLPRAVGQCPVGKLLARDADLLKNLSRNTIPLSSSRVLTPAEKGTNNETTDSS